MKSPVFKFHFPPELRELAEVKRQQMEKETKQKISMAKFILAAISQAIIYLEIDKNNRLHSDKK